MGQLDKQLNIGRDGTLTSIVVESDICLSGDGTTPTPTSSSCLRLLSVEESNSRVKNKSDDILDMLHNKINTLVPSKGQRCLLCSNNKLCRCPLLGYEHAEDDSKLNQAFDLLFEYILNDDYAN